jgi:histidinol-phosphate aminotransferase
MAVSRRNLLRHIGMGVGATLPILGRGSIAAVGAGDALGREGPVRLHRNENAFGPSAAVAAAIREASAMANRYPERAEEALREKIAAVHHVAPSNIVLGCGSGEVLRLAAVTFAGPGRNVVLAVPTFAPMIDYAGRAGADVIPVPLTSGYAHDLGEMRSRIDDTTGLVYVCNPNNPTGTLTRRRDLENFLDGLPRQTHVILDEAYHHYADGAFEYASFVDRPLGDDRVIVTRTFSTVYGLAGLRVGYGVAAPDVVRRLASLRLSDGVNSIAAAASLAALADQEHVRRTVQRNTDDRQEFFNQANARMLRTIDSHTNFVMLNTDRNAAEIVEHFRTHGVLVAGPFPSFPKHIRVTLGTPGEVRSFWRVWDLLPPHQMSM